MSERNNPETELLSEQIAQERVFLRRRGLIAITLWTAGMIFYLWSAMAFWINHLTWLALVMLAASTVFGYQIYRGIKLYRRGRASITQAEITQRRQEERMKLFQAAHGQLPSELRLLSLLTRAGFGVLLTGYSLWYIMRSGPLWGGPELLAIFGLLLCSSTAVDWRRAKRLQMESRAILAERLRSGEYTEGAAEINEQKEA